MPGGHALTDSLAHEPDDATRWWQAYCLAENDEAEELRQRSGRDDDHARGDSPAGLVTGAGCRRLWK